MSECKRPRFATTHVESTTDRYWSLFAFLVGPFVEWKDLVSLCLTTKGDRVYGRLPIDIRGVIHDLKALASSSWTVVGLDIELSPNMTFSRDLALLTKIKRCEIRVTEVCTGSNFALMGFPLAAQLETLCLTGRADLRSLACVYAFRALQTLIVKCSYILTDISTVCWCSNLQTLRIDGSYLLTDITPITFLPRLREVSITNCHNFVDGDPLIRCPQLQRIDLSGTSVRSLTCLQQCQNLKYLKICDMGSLVDTDTLGQLQNLQTLVMSFCPLQSQVRHIVQNPSIVYFDCLGCPVPLDSRHTLQKTCGEQGNIVMLVLPNVLGFIMSRAKR